MTGIAGEATVEAPPARMGRRLSTRTLLRLLVVVVAVVAAYYALHNRLPSLPEVISIARRAEPRWVLVAILAEAASIAMFAAQQRRLLRAFDVRMSVARALAVTYSRSAITVALPAGSAVSAGFAFQQYRLRGAGRATATTVMILSSLASAVGLALVYAGGLLTVGAQWMTGEWSEHRTAITVSLVVLGLVGVALLAGWVWWASVPPVATAAHQSDPQVSTARPAMRRMQDAVAAEAVAAVGPAGMARARRLLAPVLDAVRDARAVPPGHWIATLAFAVANWMLDLICLIAVARACDLGIGYPHLAAGYLAVQVVRQLPVTPGGIGLIETSLLASLVSAGAAQAPAAAVVLGYRLLSCWAIIPIGLLTWLGLRVGVAVHGDAPAGIERGGTPVQRDRHAGSGPRMLRRGSSHRLSRLPGNSPGGVRRPRQRLPH